MDYGDDFDALIADAAADDNDTVLYVSGDGLMINFTARATYLSATDVYIAEETNLGPGEALELAADVRARAEASGHFDAVYTGMASHYHGQDLRLHGSLLLELGAVMVDEYFDDIQRHDAASKDLFLEVENDYDTDMVTAIVQEQGAVYMLSGIVDAKRTADLLADIRSRGFTVHDGLPKDFDLP